jgi:hypothetical protein
LINIAKNHGAKENIINDLLNSKTMNHGLAMKPRKYSDILTGQFEIGKIIRVNRKNDEHTISDKIFDFLHKTIQQLKELKQSMSLTIDKVDSTWKRGINVRTMKVITHSKMLGIVP